MGAGAVIAVDVGCHCPSAWGLSALAIIGRVMQIHNCLVAAPEMAEADVLIAPCVKVSGMGAKGEQEAAIDVGYEAGRAALASGSGRAWPGVVIGERVRHTTSPRLRQKKASRSSPDMRYREALTYLLGLVGLLADITELTSQAR